MKYNPMNGELIQTTDEALSDLMSMVLSDPKKYLQTLELMLTSLMRTQKDSDHLIDVFELWRSLVKLFISRS